MSKSDKTSIVPWIMIAVVIGIGFIGLWVYLGSQKPQASTTNHAQQLTECEAPYQHEQELADNSEKYSGSYNYDASATYQALTDAANGMASCIKQYGN